MIARDKAEEYFKERLFWWKHLGIEQEFIPADTYGRIPGLMKKIPDYLVVGKTSHFVVVLEGANSLEIPESHWKAYQKWAKICGLYFFVYDSVFDQHTLIGIKKVHEAMKVGTIKNGEYENTYSIPFKMFFKSRVK